MVVAVARLEKRHVDEKTPAAASKPEHIPPPPAHFLHVPIASPKAGTY